MIDTGAGKTVISARLALELAEKNCGALIDLREYGLERFSVESASGEESPVTHGIITDLTLAEKGLVEETVVMYIMPTTGSPEVLLGQDLIDEYELVKTKKASTTSRAAAPYRSAAVKGASVRPWIPRGVAKMLPKTANPGDKSLQRDTQRPDAAEDIDEDAVIVARSTEKLETEQRCFELARSRKGLMKALSRSSTSTLRRDPSG